MKLQPKNQSEFTKGSFASLTFFFLKSDILKTNLKSAFKGQKILFMGKVCALLCMSKSTSSVSAFPITTGNSKKDASLYINSERTL